MGVFWALELVRNKETREPLVPYNATGADNAPMAAFGAACKKNGLWPFINMNRTHVVPPCNITEAEAKEGLAVLDEALTVADEHTVLTLPARRRRGRTRGSRIPRPRTPALALSGFRRTRIGWPGAGGGERDHARERSGHPQHPSATDRGRAA